MTSSPIVDTACKRYTPAVFEDNIRSCSEVLPPTTEAAVKAETAARAEVRAGCHTDDCHNVTDKDGLHISYMELWKETGTIKAGAINSHADVVQKTLGDALDCVCHL